MAYRLGFLDGDKYLPDHWFGTNPEYDEYKNDDQLYGSRDVTAYFRKNQKIPDAELPGLPARFTFDGHKGFVPDFLTRCGGLGWFVSGAFRELVERFEPGMHQFIPIQGYNREGLTRLNKEFFLANICQFLEDFVDVERSDLYRHEETLPLDIQAMLPPGYVEVSYRSRKAPPEPIYLRAEVTAGRHYWGGGTVGDGDRWYSPFVSDALWQAMQDVGLSKLESEYYSELHKTDPV